MVTEGGRRCYRTRFPPPFRPLRYSQAMDTLQSVPAPVHPSERRAARAQQKFRNRFQVQILVALFFAAVFSFYDLHTMRGTTFYSDEWEAISAYSWSPHVLLTPHGGHNFYFSTMLWNTVMAIFGTKSYLPF